MKNVLIVLPSFTSANGIAKVIMNYYESLIIHGYKLDFLVISNKDTDEEYRNKIKKYNSTVYVMPKHTKLNRFFIVKKFCMELLKKNNYDIIHVNLVDIYALAILSAAKKSKICNRIYHVHNPNSGKTFFGRLIKVVLNMFCKNNANIFYSCSKLAADSMLKNKEYKIIRNCIDIKKYKFNECDRQKIRTQLGIKKDEILVGTISRIEEQKNPFFNVDIIYELINMNQKIKLLYVGDGSLRKKVEEYVNELNIADKIIFVGSQDNVNEYYSAMDVFTLPSKFEGLGIVFVEAQASGLPVFASDCVPRDICVTDLVNFVSLKECPRLWAKKISGICDKNLNRTDYNMEVINSGYDINNVSDGSLLYNYSQIRRNII